MRLSKLLSVGLAILMLSSFSAAQSDDMFSADSMMDTALQALSDAADAASDAASFGLDTARNAVSGASDLVRGGESGDDGDEGDRALPNIPEFLNMA